MRFGYSWLLQRILSRFRQLLQTKRGKTGVLCTLGSIAVKILEAGEHIEFVRNHFPEILRPLLLRADLISTALVILGVALILWALAKQRDDDTYVRGPAPAIRLRAYGGRDVTIVVQNIGGDGAFHAGGSLKASDAGLLSLYMRWQGSDVRYVDIGAGSEKTLMVASLTRTTEPTTKTHRLVVYENDRIAHDWYLSRTTPEVRVELTVKISSVPPPFLPCETTFALIANAKMEMIDIAPAAYQPTVEEVTSKRYLT